MLNLLRSLSIDLSPLRRHRAFRLLFAGRAVSIFALSALSVTLSLQVFAMTGSSLHVALVNTALGVCAVLGALLGGVLADRFDRRRVIVISRGAAIVGFALLGLNASLPEPSLVAIYVLAAFDGAVGAVSAAAFGAAVPSVVPEAELPSTGAAMALSADLGSAVAPLLAGVLSAAAGPVAVYWSVVALSVLSWTFLVRVPPLPLPAGNEGATTAGESVGLLARARAGAREGLTGLREGVRFARGDRVVGGVLLIGFIQIFLASPYVLIPELVTEHWGGDDAAVGLMYAAPAIGALIAGLASGWIDRCRRLGMLMVLVFAACAVGVAGVGLAPVLWLAVVLMGLVGAGDVIGEILRFTVLSSRTPDALRGRISSLWQAQTTVGDALGGPLLSMGARYLGPAGAVAVGGGLAAILTLSLLWRRPELRRYTFDPASEPDAMETSA